MCSVAGVYGGEDDCFLRTARTEMQGRGPKVGEYHSQQYHALSHRLGIVGSAAYDMPYAYGNHIVTFNGEIYNHKELAERYDLSTQAYESDTHALVEGYAKFGKAFFRYLEGIYAFAIYDQKTSDLTLARDQFGTKPLFFGQSGLVAYFASEMKAFKNTELDQATMIGPGELLSITKDGVERSTITFEPQVRYDEFDDTFHDAIAKHLPTEKFALLLSGGIDSVLLAYYLQDYGADFETYSAKSHDFSADSDDAQKVAKLLGLKHHVVEFDSGKIDVERLAYRMETANPRILYGAAILDQLVGRIAKDGLRIVMDGNGADEMFMGYREFEAVPRSQFRQATEEYLSGVFPNAQAQRADRIAGSYQIEGRHPYLFQPFLPWLKAKHTEEIKGKKPLLDLLRKTNLGDVKENILQDGKKYQLISGTTGKSSFEAYFSEKQQRTMTAIFHESGFYRFVDSDAGEGEFFDNYAIRNQLPPSNQQQ